MKNLKDLKHFEMIKLNASCNTAKFQVRRHNAKYNDNVRLTKINDEPYAYRDFFDLKEVSGYTIIKMKKQLAEALDKIQIIE